MPESTLLLPKRALLLLLALAIPLCTGAAEDRGDCLAGFERVAPNGFGDSNNRYAWSMTTFGDRLYVGTLNRQFGGQIWRYDGDGWERVVADGLDSARNQGVRNLASCLGQLWAGTDNLEEGSELWRSGSGDDWTAAFTGGLGNPDLRTIRALYCSRFNGIEYLYFGMQNTAGGARLYRTRDGVNFRALVLNGFGDPRNSSVHAFESFDGALYAGTRNVVDGLQIWRTFDGVNFEAVVGPGAETPGGFDYESTGATMDLHVFDGQLYLGTINAFGGFGVYRSADGVAWEKIGEDGFGVPGNDYSWRYATFDGELWLGTLNAFSFFGFPTGAGVWRSADGLQWEELVGSPGATLLGWGFEDTDNIGVRTLQVYRDALYLGTAQDSRPQVDKPGLEIWRWTGDGCPAQPRGTRTGDSG